MLFLTDMLDSCILAGAETANSLILTISSCVTCWMCYMSRDISRPILLWYAYTCFDNLHYLYMMSWMYFRITPFVNSSCFSLTYSFAINYTFDPFLFEMLPKELFFLTKSISSLMEKPETLLIKELVCVCVNKSRVLIWTLCKSTMCWSVPVFEVSSELPAVCHFQLWV